MGKKSKNPSKIAKREAERLEAERLEAERLETEEMVNEYELVGPSANNGDLPHINPNTTFQSSDPIATLKCSGEDSTSSSGWFGGWFGGNSGTSS